VKKLNRREFVLQSSAGMALGLIPGAKAFPQIVVPPAQPNLVFANSYSEQFPDMLVSNLTASLNALAEKWDRVRDQVKTPDEAETRHRDVRQKMLEMVGGLPERTPLQPIVASVLERDGYRIENVMYQSRPNFWVTAILYVPTTGKGPFPAILSPSGHYEDAGRASAYQAVHLDLVKNGFVVLAPDPIGQGERREHWDTTTRTSWGSTTDEHSMFGQLLWLIGEDVVQYAVWDGMRSIDYLVTRPEVDPSRIGCSGHSGGGLETIWLMAFDARVKCAACIEPALYHFWPLHIAPGEILLHGDAEHNVFPSALNGIDICDLYQSFAPRPLLIVVETYTNEAFQLASKHVKAHYELFGAGEKFATVESAEAHYWTLKLRLAATDWFCRWLAGHSGPTEEPELTIEPIENLFCTPTGSLIDSRQGDTLRSRILKAQESLPPARQVPKSAAEVESFRRETRELVEKLLRYKKVDQPLAARLLKTAAGNKFHIEKLEFLAQPGIYIPTWVFVPEHPAPNSRPILYIGDTDTETLGYPESGWGGELAQKGHTLIAVDVRGMGQTRPLHKPYDESGNWTNLFDVETTMAYAAWSMDESLLGMRVEDVVRSVDYAQSRPEVDVSRLVVIGSGMGALWGLYAAALDPRIQFVIADGGLLSYKSLAQSGRYKYGANVFVRSGLKYFDVPQIAAAIAGRNVRLLSPLSPMKVPVPIAEARQAYQFTLDTYASAGIGDRFQIIDSDPRLGPAGRYAALLS
jgi:cephalosporin-C deacetylase-like acetyl esterase